MKIAQVGEEILKSPARQVGHSEFGQAQLNTFIDDLMATMLTAGGMGIAAPQVFDPRAIMIIASRPNARYPHAPEMQPTVLINPMIKKISENNVWEWEGCLSVPGLRGRIQRPNEVQVTYQDAQGQQQNCVFNGFVARIFLHEYDHLIGKTWLDHITDSKNIMAESVWQKKFC